MKWYMRYNLLKGTKHSPARKLAYALRLTLILIVCTIATVSWLRISEQLEIATSQTEMLIAALNGQPMVERREDGSVVYHKVKVSELTLGKVVLK